MTVESTTTLSALDILPPELWTKILRRVTRFPQVLPCEQDPFHEPLRVDLDPTCDHLEACTKERWSLLFVSQAFHDLMLPELYTVIHISRDHQAACLVRTFESSERHARLMRDKTRRLDLCLGRNSPYTNVKQRMVTLTHLIRTLSGHLNRLEHFNPASPLFDDAFVPDPILPIPKEVYVQLVDCFKRFLSTSRLRSLDLRSGNGSYTLPAMPTLHTIRVSVVQNAYTFCQDAELPSLSAAAILGYHDTKVHGRPQTHACLSAFLGQHGEKLTSLTLRLSGSIPLGSLFKLLVTSCPNMRHLMLPTDRNSFTHCMDACQYGTIAGEAMSLERIGIATCYDWFPDFDDKAWTAFLEFVLHCFLRTGTESHSMKALRLVTDRMANSLRHRPAVLSKFAKSFADAGISVEDPMGEVLPILQWEKSDRTRF